MLININFMEYIPHIYIYITNPIGVQYLKYFTIYNYIFIKTGKESLIMHVILKIK